MGTEQSKTDTNPKVGVSDSSNRVNSERSVRLEWAGGAPEEESGAPVSKPPVENKTPASLRKRLEKVGVPTPFVNTHLARTPAFLRNPRAQIGKETFVPIKPQAPAFPPAPPIKPKAAAFLPAPPIKPKAAAFLPAPPIKPQAPAFLPAPPIKPQAPAFPPAPPIKPKAPAFLPAPSIKPKAPAFPPAPSIKPKAPAFPPAPSIKPKVQTSAPAFTRDPEEDLCVRVVVNIGPEEKRYDPNDPTLTIVDAADELDFLCEEFDSPRALMSCGHAVTPMSLTNWCRWQLDKGYNNFMCGTTKCNATWSFEEVQKMALLTPEEVEYFERKMFNNTKDCFDVKACPGCKSTVLRKDPDNLCVQCPVCTMDRKKHFNFCWQCLKEWRGPAPRWDRCQNEGCVDEALQTLRKCPEVTFRDMPGVTGCPSVRACPTCGLLLEHNRTNCKNIICRRCKIKFCFVCLQEKKVCGKTSCPYKMCQGGVAPRQDRIAVGQWDVNSPSVCR